MFVVSVKTTRSHVWIGLALAVMALVAMLSLAGGEPATSTVVKVSDDVARRQVLQSLGYEVAPTEALVREIVIPIEADSASTMYQELQVAAGYDLSPYRGKRVKCWQYGVTNYPQAPNTVAHLYVYKDKVIGGDISSVEGEGFCHGLLPLPSEESTAGEGHGTTG